MKDDIAHEFEKYESSKAIWYNLQEHFEVMFSTQIQAIRIKLVKLKCGSIKGFSKHLCVLGSLFANLEAIGHPYADKQKYLTVVNSLPNHPDWNHMHLNKKKQTP